MIPKNDLEVKLYSLLEEAYLLVEAIRDKHDVDDSDAKKIDELYLSIVSTKLGAAAQIARYKGSWAEAKAATDLATSAAVMLDNLLQRIETKQIIKDLVKDMPSSSLDVLQKPSTGDSN